MPANYSIYFTMMFASLSIRPPAVAWRLGMGHSLSVAGLCAIATPVLYAQAAVVLEVMLNANYSRAKTAMNELTQTGTEMKGNAILNLRWGRRITSALA